MSLIFFLHFFIYAIAHTAAASTEQRSSTAARQNITKSAAVNFLDGSTYIAATDGSHYFRRAATQSSGRLYSTPTPNCACVGWPIGFLWTDPNALRHSVLECIGQFLMFPICAWDFPSPLSRLHVCYPAWQLDTALHG